MCFGLFKLSTHRDLGQGPRLKEKWVQHLCRLLYRGIHYVYQLSIPREFVGCGVIKFWTAVSCNCIRDWLVLCQMLCHVVFMVYYCDLVFCGCGYYFGSGLSD